MGRLFLLLVSLLLAAPATAQVHTASLSPIGTVRAGRLRSEDDPAIRALRRALRSDLIDAGLTGAWRHYRLPTSWARLAGVAPVAPETARRRLSCRLTADLLDLSVGIDLHNHRGWGALVEVDLDDRRVALETAARGLRYGLSYEERRGAVQALVRLPF